MQRRLRELRGYHLYLIQKLGKLQRKHPAALLLSRVQLLRQVNWMILLFLLVVLHEAICVEEFSKCKALGRVFLRTLARTKTEIKVIDSNGNNHVCVVSVMEN
ncbi:hypothetical protein V6N12_052439 [Hibiscus sabdariffa]|uniref:Uncharacterized protein n=1 Tax=Hibiscus sabdariffa TaxID=183260 RepID=A0ABR2GIH2_9ROSI